VLVEFYPDPGIFKGYAFDMEIVREMMEAYREGWKDIDFVID